MMINQVQIGFRHCSVLIEIHHGVGALDATTTIILTMIIIFIFFLSPSVVKIPRAKNIKLKSKVGMARGPVLHR